MQRKPWHGGPLFIGSMVVAEDGAVSFSGSAAPENRNDVRFPEVLGEIEGGSMRQRGT
jgi:hypothetical protein